ncbi:hypothetical protein B0H16DRAFT_1724906 [Mycena metata]|uniref:F-box domain-containing protein n=1 Tax=Mycena metata TaxID=1033252 RepID=A0AAD7ISK9_9AGAR|nr:hypothetical protein B0H16DRAFT_1725470 [Mycena metata]KAJ7749637.1 hypothetical protein B0H16DRAFT_1724906 [Mycena metata]
MASASEPILPPEIIDIIIDNLHNHPRTLRACGLVSRNWLGGSRHHLFGRGIYLAARDLETFRSLVQSPCNTLSFHLRSIRVAGFQYGELTQLWSLLPNFTQLRSIHIHGNPIRFDSDVVGAHKLASVRSVALSRAIFTAYDGLNRFLLRFPFLTALEVDRAGFSQGADTEITPLHFTFKLETLKITVTPALMAWLRWTGFSLGAQSVVLDFESVEPGVSEYFIALGTQLQTLSLKFRNPAQLAIFSEHPRLGTNTSLRSIRIRHAFYILGETHVGVPPSLARLLRQVESSAIEELAFDATLVHPGLNWSYSPPQEVATILDGVGTNFARLQKINFYGPWDRIEDILGQQFKSIILTLLPIQSARGIIRVVPNTFT